VSNLTETIDKINKSYGFKMVGGAETKQKKYRTFQSTTPSISYLFRGDIPRTTIQLLGMPSGGKSTTAYMMCGQAQKQLKKEWQDEVDELEQLAKPNKEQQLRLSYLKERGHQRVAYLDIEFSTTEEWLEINGVDTEDLIYIAPENQTAEQLFQICLDLIASDGIGLMVLDSVPALVSSQSMEKTMMEKTYAGISAPMSTFCSKLLPLCNKHKCGFIFVNQPRQDLSGYNRVLYNGGQMLKHTIQVNMLLKKGAYIDENYNELKAHPEEAAGNLVECEVLKNKATKPGRNMCKYTIDYNTGIDGINDTIILAIGFGIITKAGAWLSMGEEKWQGKTKLVEYLRENPDVFDSIKQQVMEMIK
jgi:recA bacterial DNA recombination protein